MATITKNAKTYSQMKQEGYVCYSKTAKVCLFQQQVGYCIM